MTRAEAKRAGFDSPHDVLAYLLLGPEELRLVRRRPPSSTPTTTRCIEFAAPRDLLGYSSFDPYLAKVYGPMWPYGHLTGLVEGYEGATRASDVAQLARSLLAHGKSREAKLWQGRAEAAAEERTRPSEVEHTRMLLDLVATREDRDPEIPLAPAGGLTPPVIPGATASPPTWPTAWREEYLDIAAQVKANMYASAYKILEDWPERRWGGALGKDFSMLSGFLDYKAEFYGDAVDELKPLADDAEFVERRPELLYYLGRAYFANASCAKAVKSLEEFIELQSALGRPVLPESTEP